MSIIEYFLRRSRLNLYHKTVEDIAELDERIEIWHDKKSAGKDAGIPVWLMDKLTDYRGTRARLIVRKKRLEKELGLETNPPV